MRIHIRLLVGSVALIGLVGLLLVAMTHRSQAASITSITVTTTADDLLANGNCSLREALLAANTDSAADACPAGQGADTIILPAGTYVLTQTGRYENAGLTGDLDVLGQLTISGATSATTVIDAGQIDRALDVHLTHLALHNLTIQHGRLLDEGPQTDSYAQDGAGMLVRGPDFLSHVLIDNSSLVDNVSSRNGGGLMSTGAVTLTNSLVAGNRAYYGAGIYSTSRLVVQASLLKDQLTPSLGDWNDTFGGAIYNQGALWISDSTLRHNTGAGHGGGLYNKGQATIANTAILSNTAYAEPGGFGGGINNKTGTLTLTNSLLQFNHANVGSGLSNQQGLVHTDSTDIANNTSRESSGYGDAGGVANFGRMTITKSTIRDNQAKYYAGGIWNVGEIDKPATWLEIEQSTISGNTAHFIGGGMINTRAHLRLTNVTISGNTANKYGGAIGVADDDQLSDVVLNNVTITNNQLEHIDPSTDHRSGAGIYANKANVITITNSLIAGNLDPIGGKPDIDGAVVSQGYNLIQNTSGTTLTGTLTGNLLGVDPQLGPLQLVGAGPPLHPLLASSPARDAASPAAPGSPAPACALSDQRGAARPLDGDGDGQARCDIGAFEADGAAQSQPTLYLPLLKR